MELTGKINVFVKRLSTGNNVFSTGIAVKGQDGKYRNKYIDVRIGKDVASLAQLNAMEEKVCYVVNVTKAFLTCDFYKDKNGNEQSKFVIQIQEAKVLEANKCHEPKENGLPF